MIDTRAAKDNQKRATALGVAGRLAHLAALVIAMGAPSLCLAADKVALRSNVFVEKHLFDANSRGRVVLEQPAQVAPGDRLVFILSYHNAGSEPANNFAVTNPLPAPVAYERAAGRQTAVSIDGGRSWGTLARLRARDTDGRWRAARPEDVTHVRWTLAEPIPAGGRGTLSFRGVVK